MTTRQKKEPISIKFLDFAITKISFELNEDFFEKQEKKEDAKIAFNPEFKGEIAFDKENSILVVKLGVKINWQTENSPFDIEVIGKGVFQLNKEPEDIEKLARINCAAIIFPFIRETIADVTRRSGLPPLLIPPTNFVRMFEDIKKQGSVKKEDKDKIE